MTGVLRAGLLDAQDWLAHGFGTRHTDLWTPPAGTARLRQIHSAIVAEVEKPGDCGEGDALMTAVPDLWLEIRTADCVPILIADPAHRAITAVHAGWRGTAAGVTARAVEAMNARFGSDPARLLAAIGPCILSCCFEVGDEVAALFPDFARHEGTRWFVDLEAANRDQLTKAGVAAIESLRRCTCCEAGEFHSFRRDKGPGRMVSAIAIKKGASEDAP